MEDDILKKVDYTAVDGGTAAAAERVVRETELAIRVNGSHVATAMILATMEEEFVTGHLFGQGIIGSAADITSLTVTDDTAEVTVTGKSDVNGEPGTVRSDLIVRKEDVFDCVRAILKSDIFDETEAVHSAGLFLNGTEPVCIAEDLGRHHALDKVIGYGLLHGTNFGETLAASTGRQPSEMLLKCRRAGIPVIATKGVPTTLAIDIANEGRIAIAGLVRGTTMLVYSTPARIV